MEWWFSAAKRSEPQETLIPHNKTTHQPTSTPSSSSTRQANTILLYLWHLFRGTIVIIQQTQVHTESSTHPKRAIICTGEGLPENMCSKVLTIAQLFPLSRPIHDKDLVLASASSSSSSECAHKCDQIGWWLLLPWFCPSLHQHLSSLLVRYTSLIYEGVGGGGGSTSRMSTTCKYLVTTFRHLILRTGSKEVSKFITTTYSSLGE